MFGPEGRVLEEAFVCFTGMFSEACIGVSLVLLTLVCCCLLRIMRCILLRHEVKVCDHCNGVFCA